MPPDILTRLRSSTHWIHHALHRHALLLPLSDGSISTRDYLKVLRCFYGFYDPLERKILASPLAAAYQEAASPSVAWLVDDLVFYGESFNRIPLCDDLPKVENLADLMGLLYVKEGSLLGGRAIHKQLQNSLPAREHAFSFFAGLGDATPAHWRSVVNRLDCSSREHSTKAICASAETTFIKFQAWLNQNAAARSSAA